ncbi:putative sugar kinase [Thiovulum sp. ES]|nr:putative sugar kinase [Thiovulum sp. ES]
MSKVKTVGFFLRPNKPELLKPFKNIKKKFEAFGVEVLIDRKSANMIGAFEGVECSQLCEKSDILVSLGGDGTLLSTVRKSFGFNKPILSIKAGNLGFLVDLDVRDIEPFMKTLVDGEYKIEKRQLLNIEIGEKRELALNDLSITNSERMRIANIYVYTVGEKSQLLNSYYGDGLLISTATGSTAYNLSLGGPILYPEMRDYILTPIAPHSLSQRPIILPPELKISLGMEGSDGLIKVDGQKNIFLPEHTRVNISVHKEPVQIIRTGDFSFFKNLREKLKWGD